ncbi:MAG: ferrous iron transport protein B [Deltaproteobacteria bacterium]|nr:ferrous iron transport protein B [Deltaproteobacteria bacterium]
MGQPNSGKSSLLNALAGAKAIVSNYPGTTVELTRAQTYLERVKVEIIDTPGIYSLSDATLEERVTKEYILERDYDLVVNIVDVTSLERGLYLTLQLRETGIPLIVALNFVEDASKKGVSININKLSDALGVHVVALNPLTGTGLKALSLMISKTESLQTEVKPLIIQYDDHIEEALKEIFSKLTAKTNVYRRFAALRALEGDEEFRNLLKDAIDNLLPEEVKQYHPDLSEDIMLTRYGCASVISKRCINVTSIKGLKEPLSERLDRVLINPGYGWIICLSTIIAIFYIMLVLGGFLQDKSVEATKAMVDWIITSWSLKGVAADVLGNALRGAASGIGIALAYVLIFYILLSLLEDTGLLSRIVLSFSRFLSKLDLPGNAVVPMMLNFGCTVLAISATRILRNRGERLRTTATFVGVPCSSRTAIIMGLVASYAGIHYAVATYLITILSGLLFSKISGLFVKVEPSPFLLELPPYRKPLLQNVAVKSWIRMQDFVKVVIPLLIFGGVVYSLMEYLGLVDFLISPLIPLGLWLRLPPKAVLPLVYGYLQKDLTISMLFTVLGTTDIRIYLSSTQLFIFGLQASIQFPCIIASSMAWKEFGWKIAVYLTIGGFLYGVLVTGLISNFIAFLSL